ncbi:vomeronasal type-2 receptor 1-like [Microcaecilia unicolor]|uniref:Vomeronasal type-2 receptor 1-like n=1 Tax=Microcaecilia unicolor TaxID=1415580 RepID=A0A6P7Z7Y9_9AMPH|nr:vomeronasal type-2 receptor 1-like [Microcaecilia unicolor]
MVLEAPGRRRIQRQEDCTPSTQEVLTRLSPSSREPTPASIPAVLQPVPQLTSQLFPVSALKRIQQMLDRATRIGVTKNTCYRFRKFKASVVGAQNEAEEPTCRLIGKFDLHGFLDAKNHELILGGMFPLHSRIILVNESSDEEPTSPKCEDFNFRSLRWARAMIHAINEINNRSDILPNITLGYQIYDTCFTISKSVEGTLAYLTGQNETTPNFRCSAGAPLAAVVGAGGSALSIATARILGLYYFPQMGYASSCSVLSDKFQFPSFHRTIPNDEHQSRGMAQMVIFFGWTWVGAIAADDDYGKYGIKSFKEEVEKKGVCVAFSEILPRLYNKDGVQKIIDTLQKYTGKVIIVFSSDIDLVPLMEAVAQSNITDKTWIASEAWITSDKIAKPEYFSHLGGTIGFGIRKASIPNFEKFLYELHPENGEDELVYEFWENAFNCTWHSKRAWIYTDNSTIPTHISDKPCTGNEKLQDINNTYTDVSELRITYSVYKAVYTVAHALHDLDGCVPGSGPFIPHSMCANILDFEPWQLMYYLKHVKFTTFANESMTFDEQGDVPGYYDILNWQFYDGKINYVKIGQYVALANNYDLTIKNSSIVWNTDTGKAPVSVCSISCVPGYRKGIRQGEPVCCFDCIQCAEGEITNETDARECISCTADYWSNVHRNECVLKEVEFLAYEEALGITLIALSVFGVLIVFAVTVVYILHRDTPLVKANDRELSFMIQFSLVITLLTSILFVGKPEEWSCMARQTTLGLGFSLCLSCVLGKTIVLMLISRAAKSKSPEKTGEIPVKPIHQKCVALIGLIIEIGICIAYLLLMPPSVYKNMESQNVKIIFECNEGSIEFLCSMFGFDVFLAILAFIAAFVARKLPDNFNEAKFVTFGMLVFFIVWISFVPAYLSTRGKFKVAVEIFAILASSFGLLGCIFAPKCYIILLKPERNTEEIVGGKARMNDKSAPPTSASITSEINVATVSTVVLDE